MARSASRKFLWSYLIVSLLVCLSLTYVSWMDKSWGAMWIAIVGSPIANLVLMILGFSTATTIHRHNPLVKVRRLRLAVFAFPVIGALSTFVATFMLGLRGC